MSKVFANPITGSSAPSCPSGQRTLSAAAGEQYSCEFGSNKYYALCGLGGVLSCGITHTAVTPLDLVKCRLQVNKEKYKSLGNGFKITVAEQGARGLLLDGHPPLSATPCKVSAS